MSALATRSVDEELYRQLVSKTPPHVIHSEAENELYISHLEALTDKGELTAEEEQFAELLTLLIEDFEDRHYQLESASPIEIVSELMAANGLKQVDLVETLGTPSLVSEFLSGKRKLSKAQIQKLSQRFNVSPEVFFRG